MTHLSTREQDNILRWDGRRLGFYEVYYLKWNDPNSRTAGWIRYTLTSPELNVAKPYCELWGIFFDVDQPSKTFAVKKRFPIFDLSWESNRFFVGIGGAELTMEACRGAIENGQSGNSLSWDLAFHSDSDTYRYFPSERYYRGGYPKTKGLSPHMNARFSGKVVANGRTIEMTDAPGQQTHLWGTRHAQRWAWGHCNTFVEDSEAIWEGLDAQIPLGPVNSPHFKLFYVKANGQEHFFNDLKYWVLNKSRWELGRWEFQLKNDQIKIEGMVHCEYDEMVAVTYTDPDGTKLWCNNSKVATIRMNLFDAAGKTLGSLSSPNGCAAEFVDRKIFEEVPVRV